MYRAVQQVFKNAAYARVLPMGLWTGMCVFGIVHLVYKVLRDLPDWCTQLVAPVQGPSPGNVQSRAAGVQRSRLCQCASHGLVNWHVRFRNRTFSVQGAMGPPRFMYTASGASTGHRFRSCTEPNSRCTKMPFLLECFPWVCELARSFSESYT